MAFFNARQKFSDGSIIWPINRDEYIYQRADGRVAHPYLGVAGGRSEYDRVLTLSSLDAWIVPAGMVISLTDRVEILKQMRQYKKVKRLKLGVVLVGGTTIVVPFDENYIKSLEN